MSFIDQINTDKNSPAPIPRPNMLQRVGNSITDFGSNAMDSAVATGQRTLDNAGANAEAAVRGYANRTIDSLGRSVKDALSEKVAKRVTNPIKDALGKIGGGLMEDFFDGFAGDPAIPPQYTGTTNVQQNAHEMYHSDNYAMFKYGLKKDADKANDSHPAMKFMFAADFVFDTSNPHFSQHMMKNFSSALTMSLKNTTFPKMEIETDEINRYNKSIISSKKVRYQPITATFGETVGHNTGADNSISVIEMWNSINQYYINDQRRFDATNAPFGHRSGNPSRNIIKYLDLYFIWPTSTRRLRLVNPFITSFSYDNMDYQTDEQILATLDIKYEFYELTQVNGSFSAFINEKVGESIANGTPYEFTGASPLKNLDVVSGEEDEDDQRLTDIDNAYARAMTQLGEQEAISASSDLLSSTDPVKRELGRQAVERSVDGISTINQATGVSQAISDMAHDVGKSANQALGGLF